jgi:nicotinamide-nucleotide amidase
LPDLSSNIVFAVSSNNQQFLPESCIMTDSLNAEIIAIGTEILLGEITDTNSVYIARLLRDIGLNLFYMTSVGDNEQRIADVIRTSLSRARVIITCGGLGPTIDDMTRQGVAQATDRGLTFHQDLLDKIAERFTSFRAQMTENNRRQAYLPDNAIVIENPVGTAPSFIVEYEDKVVISLPGVPREMKYLMTERVIPFLRDRFELGSGIIKARVLRTAGIGESLLDTRIGVELLEASNPTVGLAAHTGQVDIRITAKASSGAEADSMIAPIEHQLREKIGKYIFGYDEEKIEDVLTQLLAQHNVTLTVSETGIGTPISQIIESTVEGKKLFVNKQIYSTPTELYKTLSVNSDTPIRQIAEFVAQFICQTTGSNAAIVVISQPDMDEYHADSEDGTAIAVYMDGNTRSRVFGFGAVSDIAGSWVSTWSMSMLWQMLQEKFEPK